MSCPGDDDVSALRFAAGVDEQAGVLAWLPGTDPMQFCIVTSRRTGRWILPKGNIDPGMSPREAAEQEALEEAGLVGTAEPEPIAIFRAPKIRPPLIWTIEVTYYPMRVDEVLDDWIEADLRTRRFVTLDEARELLWQPEVIAVVERFLANASTACDGT